jgi:hypothetical protein
MGLLAGQVVRRAGTAPLGDPSIYFVRGFRLALRRTEACRVLLEPDSSESDLADRAVQRAHDPREAAAS